MDLCRAYYRQHNMTAPVYRIEYIYTFTDTPNYMRKFLITTAAYRYLCDPPIAPGTHLPDTMRTILVKRGDVAVDFAEALINLNKNGLEDVRKGPNCAFHEHADGMFCPEAANEPWQSN